MTIKEQIKFDISEGIKKIESLSANDYDEVSNIYLDLYRKFSSLKETDFINKTRFEDYQKTMLIEAESVQLDLIGIENKSDVEIENNFIQTRIQLRGMLIYLENQLK